MSWSIFMGSHDATTPWWMQMLALSRHTWLATIYHNSRSELQNLSKWDPFDACRFRFESVWMRCLHHFGNLNRSGDSFRLVTFIYYFIYAYSFAIIIRYRVIFVSSSFRWNNDRKKENSIYPEDWFWIKVYFPFNFQLRNQQ